MKPSASSQPGAASAPLPLTEAALEALEIIKRGSAELLVESELAQKLARAERSGQPLRVKLGLDPTAPDLHLGHAVVLNKARQLQELGHKVIFLIGDFTAMIGDPSGRNVTRPALAKEEVEKNAMTYFNQASLVLDPARTEIRRNSEWCDNLGARGMIELASRHTVARMMERDDFAKRYKSNAPISVHEFLYPLIQGYDSVELRADVELGGTDQIFNLLVGRELQKSYGQERQCALAMPLLEGLDGVEKMSKSKGNWVGLTEAPNMMFGKLMRISDPMMWRYFELLSLRPPSELASLRAAVDGGANPRDAKVALAKEIVARFHSSQAAEGALADFVNRSNGGVPDDAPEMALAGAPMGIAHLLKESGLCASTSEAMRMVEQKGARIDGVVIEDKALRVQAGVMTLQVGKRKFVRLTLTA